MDKLSLVGSYCYLVDEEMHKRKIINAAIESEKKDHEKSHSGIRYIVSKDINNMYKLLDQIRDQIESIKGIINKSMTGDEYRKIIVKMI